MRALGIYGREITAVGTASASLRCCGPSGGEAIRFVKDLGEVVAADKRTELAGAAAPLRCAAPEGGEAAKARLQMGRLPVWNGPTFLAARRRRAQPNQANRGCPAADLAGLTAIVPPFRPGSVNGACPRRAVPGAPPSPGSLDGIIDIENSLNTENTSCHGYGCGRGAKTGGTPLRSAGAEGPAAKSARPRPHRPGVRPGYAADVAIEPARTRLSHVSHTPSH